MKAGKLQIMVRFGGKAGDDELGRQYFEAIKNGDPFWPAPKSAPLPPAPGKATPETLRRLKTRILMSSTGAADTSIGNLIYSPKHAEYLRPLLLHERDACNKLHRMIQNDLLAVFEAHQDNLSEEIAQRVLYLLGNFDIPRFYECANLIKNGRPLRASGRRILEWNEARIRELFSEQVVELLLKK